MCVGGGGSDPFLPPSYYVLWKLRARKTNERTHTHAVVKSNSQICRGRERRIKAYPSEGRDRSRQTDE